MADLSHLSIPSIKAILKRRGDSPELLSAVANFKKKHWTGSHPFDDTDIQFKVAKYGSKDDLKKLVKHSTLRSCYHPYIAERGGIELHDDLLEKPNLHPSAMDEIYATGHMPSIKKLRKRTNLSDRQKERYFRKPGTKRSREE